MHNYLRALTKRFGEGQAIVQERRGNWNNFSNLAVGIFAQIKEEAENQRFFETINYRQSDPTVSINQNYLHFWAGKKHTGMSVVTRQRLENGAVRTSWDAVVEDSGCLTMSQAPNGGVFFIAFPCKSKVSTWRDEYMVFKHFNNPSEIEYSHIKEAVEFYLKYMLITSFCSEPTRAEKISLAWKKFRFEDQWFNLFKGAGTVAKIALSILKGF